MYIHTCVLPFFFLACMKTPGVTASSFLCTSFRNFLGRCCGAHGLLAGLFVAVPHRSHSASSRAAKWLFRSWVLEATVLAGGVLAGMTGRGSVSVRFFPEALALFHELTKIALLRALGLAFRGVTKPAGPLARVGAAFAVCCDLFRRAGPKKAS